MQQEAIEVGKASTRHFILLKPANDVLIAQEAMQKFNIEKVRKISKWCSYCGSANKCRKLLSTSRKRYTDGRAYPVHNFIYWLWTVWCPERRNLALHCREELWQLCDARYVSCSVTSSLHMLISFFRDQAFHLLLPWALCNLAVQDSIDTP